MIFYTFKELQERLKKEKLPYSRPYLTIIEKMGVFNRPSNVLMLHKRNKGLSRAEMRIFTKEDIEEIVEKVRKFKNL